MINQPGTRRKFLAGVSTISSLLIAGCASDDGESDDEVQEETDRSGDSETEQEIGGNDPEITLSVSIDFDGAWMLKYVYEGASGTESEREFGSGNEEVSVPGDATYVEADVQISRVYSWPTQGSLGLELTSGSTIVDSCEDYASSPECHVEGRTQ